MTRRFHRNLTIALVTCLTSVLAAWVALRVEEPAARVAVAALSVGVWLSGYAAGRRP